MNDNLDIEIIDDIELQDKQQVSNSENKIGTGYHEPKSEGKFIIWFLFIFLLLFIIFLPWISDFLSKYI